MDIYSNLDLKKETSKRRMSMSPFCMLHKEDPNKFCHHKCMIRGCFPDLLMSDEPPTKLHSLFSFPFDIPLT